MKTSILIICFAIFSAVVSAQNTFSGTKSGDGAVISWENDIHDFGKIKKDVPVSITYKFKNDGLKPLIITNVESSCGCTVPEYPRKPIKAMQSGEITATFDAKTLGVFSKSISVTTNASEKPKVLILKGEVVP